MNRPLVLFVYVMTSCISNCSSPVDSPKEKGRDIEGVPVVFCKQEVRPEQANLVCVGNKNVDLEPLLNKKNVKSLILDGSGVEDFSILRQITSLEYLLLGFTRISSLSGIESLAHLKDLDISGTQIADIGPIASLSELKELNLAHTKVKSLSALTKLRNLERLDLSNTRLDSLLELKEIVSLRTVDVSATRVEDDTWNVLVELKRSGRLVHVYDGTPPDGEFRGPRPWDGTMP